MRSSHSRVAATVIAGVFVIAACSSVATSIPIATPTPSPSAMNPASTATAQPSPVGTPNRTPAASPTAEPTRSPDAVLRDVDLTAILEVDQADRFETFGGGSIRVKPVWSPNDLGLGGTCGTTNVPWLECLSLADWMVQPVSDGPDGPFTQKASCYEGPRLEILYQPGFEERLGLGDGPVGLIGHFGDPASQGCRPENRAACRDRFVVTAIEQTRR